MLKTKVFVQQNSLHAPHGGPAGGQPRPHERDLLNANAAAISIAKPRDDIGMAKVGAEGAVGKALPFQRVKFCKHVQRRRPTAGQISASP